MKVSPLFALLLGLCLGLAVLIWREGGRAVATLNAWESSGKTEVATNQKLLTRAQTWQHQSAVAHQRLHDTVTTLLGMLAVKMDSGAMLLARSRTADQYHAAAETFAQASRVCAVGLALCQRRADSLFTQDSLHTDSLRVALRGADTTLARGLKVASCHLLLVLPCLTRGQSLEVGIGLGIVGTLLLVHH